MPADECRDLLTELAGRPSFTDTLRVRKHELNTLASSSEAWNPGRDSLCIA
jgi:hypothetical protein